MIKANRFKTPRLAFNKSSLIPFVLRVSSQFRRLLDVSRVDIKSALKVRKKIVRIEWANGALVSWVVTVLKRLCENQFEVHESLNFNAKDAKGLAKERKEGLPLQPLRRTL